MARHEHFIKATKGNKMPKYIASIGLETDYSTFKSEQKYQLQHLIDWTVIDCQFDDNDFRKYRVTNGRYAVEFWNHMTRLLGRGGTLWLFGYGGSEILSLMQFWERLEDKTFVLKGHDHWADGSKEDGTKGSKVGLAVLEDPPTHLLGKIVGRAGNLKFVDIRNYGVEDYKEINDEYGQQSEPGYFHNLLSHRVASISHDRARATLLFVQDIMLFLQRNNLGTLQSTAASQSYYTFRRKYISGGMLVHNNIGVLADERQSLHGGRCEVFRFGKVSEPVFHYDFSSMYPSVCIDQPLPIAYSHSIDNPTLPDVANEMNSHLVIARVIVNTKRNAFPLEHGGVVLWPTGRFLTSLAGPELFEALMNHEIDKCLTLHCYDGFPILSEYMRDMYGFRTQFKLSGKHAMSSLIKKMLVSCIGKFGQRNKRWVDMQDETADEPYSSWYANGKDGKAYRYRSIAWHVQREEIEDEGPESIPAITSYIMSLARMKLWTAMKCAGNGNVLYVDTDSLFVNTNGSERLQKIPTLVGAGLGTLRLVQKLDEITFLGIKHYQYGDKVVCAGLPKGQHTRVSESGEYWFREWLSAAVQMGHRPFPVRVLKKVSRDFHYQHGMVLSNGRVEPWELNTLGKGPQNPAA